MLLLAQLDTTAIYGLWNVYFCGRNLINRTLGRISGTWPRYKNATGLNSSFQGLSNDVLIFVLRQGPIWLSGRALASQPEERAFEAQYRLLGLLSLLSD